MLSRINNTEHHQSTTNTIPVTILGATGTVGQKMLLLLHNHPWFTVTQLCASHNSAGKLYGDAVHWTQPEPIPERFRMMRVMECLPVPQQVAQQGHTIHTDIPNHRFGCCRIAFSALDADVAGPIEEVWAQAGVTVISNARNHRMRSDVPLIVPEVNPDHLELIAEQPYPKPGCIITNPNCSTIGLALALKPLQDAFGIKAVQVTTMQAVSGAGYPGVASLDIIDNVIPYISGEEEKLEQEVIKILGKLESQSESQVQVNQIAYIETVHEHSINGISTAQTVITPAPIFLSASCHRVPVLDGHLESVSIKLAQKAESSTILRAWEQFSEESLTLGLPLQHSPLCYLPEKDRPQPRLDRNAGSGMTVSIGRLRPCSVLDWKFEVLVHNTIRGAAGGAVLLGELYAKKNRLVEQHC